jgi:hypothetical protein
MRSAHCVLAEECGNLCFCNAAFRDVQHEVVKLRFFGVDLLVVHPEED